MPSPEENMDDICQQLQAELDELKTSVADGSMDSAAAEEKIREIESVLTMRKS